MRQLNGFLIFIIAAITLVASSSFLSCVGKRAANVIEAKDVTGLGMIQIKALDDHGNPYQSQYRSWDQWSYDNILLEPLAFEDGVEPEGFRILKVRVTEDGYMLPHLEKVRAYHEQMKKGYDENRYDVKNVAPYSVQAAAVMVKDMNDELNAAVSRVQGEYYMPIPEWLAEEPPIYAILVPSGEVVTYGARGSGIESSAEGEGCCGGSGEASYYLYTHEGELQRTSPSFWCDLFYNDVTFERPSGKRNNRHDGYFYFTDPETDEIISVWDWNGVELELPILPPVRDIHPFVSLKPGQIKAIYEGQNL